MKLYLLFKINQNKETLIGLEKVVKMLLPILPT